MNLGALMGFLCLKPTVKRPNHVGDRGERREEGEAFISLLRLRADHILV